jgi:DNA polymerase-1
MGSKILIVDGNNLAYRAYYKFSGLTGPGGKPTSCIYGFPFILKSIISKFKPDYVYVVFDGHKDKRRCKIHPSYKERKQKLGFDFEDFKRQKEEVMALVTRLNCQVIFHSEMEADDLIYLLCRRLRGEKMILSSDKDFNQLVNAETSIYNPSKEIRITTKTIERHFGYTPEQAVDYLCLTGDSSDNIPGYPGIGEKRGMDFLKEHSSIRKFLKSNAQHKLIKNALLAEIYTRNRYLIDLRYFYRKFLLGLQIPKLGKPLFDAIYVAKISRQYAINTFSKTDFLITFKNLKQQ